MTYYQRWLAADGRGGPVLRGRAGALELPGAADGAAALCQSDEAVFAHAGRRVRQFVALRGRLVAREHDCPALQPVRAACLFWLGGWLYAFSGLHRHSGLAVQQLLRLDVRASRLARVDANLQDVAPRAGCACAVAGGLAYLFSGLLSDARGERLAADAWTFDGRRFRELRYLGPRIRCVGGQALRYLDCILVIGGRDGAAYSTGAYLLNLRTRECARLEVRGCSQEQLGRARYYLDGGAVRNQFSFRLDLGAE